MKRFAAFILLAILVAACAPPAAPRATAPVVGAAPRATVPPTAAPKPTTAPAATRAPDQTVKPGAPPSSSPQPTPGGIAVLNIAQEKLADGSVRTTASIVAPDNLGLGQMELAYPETLSLGESATVALKLSPAAQLVSLTPVAAPGKTPDVPAFVYKFSGNVQLYPLMYAELRALGVEIDQRGPIRRIVESSKPVEWRWVVRPLAIGRQELVLELSIPVIIGGVTSELSTHVLQDLRLTILVNAPLGATAVTPAPAATPARSLAQRVADSMIDNTGALAAAVIGICGTLLTVLGSIAAFIVKSKPKSQ